MKPEHQRVSGGATLRKVEAIGGTELDLLLGAVRSNERGEDTTCNPWRRRRELEGEEGGEDLRERHVDEENLSGQANSQGYMFEGSWGGGGGEER